MVHLKRLLQLLKENRLLRRELTRREEEIKMLKETLRKVYEEAVKG